MLDYLLGVTSEPQAHRSDSDRLQPRSRRRRNDARDRGRRVPRLQRERRAALDPLLPAHGGGAQRSEPGARQRGADRRPARRHDRQDQGDQEGRRHLRGDPGPQARDARAAAAGRLEAHHPAAIGARIEVRPDHEGHLAQGYKDGAADPALRLRETRPVDIDEFYSMFDKQTRKAGAGEPGAATASRSRAAARASTARSRPSFRWPSTPRRSSGTSRARAHVSRTSSRHRARRAGSSRRSRISTQRCSASLDRTFKAFARVADPYIQQSITRGPSGLDTATEVFPKVTPFLRNTQQFFTELQPGFRALRASHRDLADAFETGVTDGAQRSVAVQQPGLTVSCGRSTARERPGRADRARATSSTR